MNEKDDQLVFVLTLPKACKPFKNAKCSVSLQATPVNFYKNFNNIISYFISRQGRKLNGEVATNLNQKDDEASGRLSFACHFTAPLLDQEGVNFEGAGSCRFRLNSSDSDRGGGRRKPAWSPGTWARGTAPIIN